MATTSTSASTNTRSQQDRARMLSRASLSTVPIVLASTLAMTMTGPIQANLDRSPDQDDLDWESRRTSDTPSTDLREQVRAALAAASHRPSATDTTPAGTLTIAAAPSTYTVQAGDTVSSIAARFGLSTASVLAFNGLGWRTVIHPGQVLQLTTPGASPVAAPAPVQQPSVGSYTVAAGDTIGGIAHRHGVSTSAVLSANGLTARSIIYPGQRIVIPGGNAAPTTTPTAQPAVASAAHYTVAAGDTATGIASRHGVSLSALLAANGLSPNSTIYAGQSLTIPRVQAAGTVPASPSAVVPMTAEMTANAQTIVSVGRSLGVPEYGLVIALATAAQESTLRNLTWGDLDSVGLFQQRPSTGWGTVAQLTTPAHAARLFFGGPSNPNPGVTRGLLDIPGWQSMSVTDAAQAVQISAYPDAYAKWETSARAWLTQL